MCINCAKFEQLYSTCIMIICLAKLSVQRNNLSKAVVISNMAIYCIRLSYNVLQWNLVKKYLLRVNYTLNHILSTLNQPVDT